MRYGLMGFGAAVLIIVFVAVIKPRGRNKDIKSKYSKADLLSLGIAAVAATIILIWKFN